MWHSASFPAPPPGWQKGAPQGGGRAGGSHDTEAGPTSCSAASGANGSLQRRCLDLLRGGKSSPGLAWPGGPSIQQALMVPCWEPGAVGAPMGFKSSALWQAGPAQGLQAAASNLGAWETVWLPAGPDVAGIPRRGTGPFRWASSLCRGQVGPLRRCRDGQGPGLAGGQQAPSITVASSRWGRAV